MFLKQENNYKQDLKKLMRNLKKYKVKYVRKTRIELIT